MWPTIGYEDREDRKTKSTLIDRAPEQAACIRTLENGQILYYRRILYGWKHSQNQRNIKNREDKQLFTIMSRSDKSLELKFSNVQEPSTSTVTATQKFEIITEKSKNTKTRRY